MKTDTTQRPAHMFISDSDGGLYDTRRANWSADPIRPAYRKTFASIETPQQLLATLRAGEFAWPGGYPKFFVTSDGAALSFASVLRQLPSVLSAIRDFQNDGWRVIGCQINWEDCELTCDHSGERIASAYGEGQ
jgi:hypothetical protein